MSRQPRRKDGTFTFGKQAPPTAAPRAPRAQQADRAASPAGTPWDRAYAALGLDASTAPSARARAHVTAARRAALTRLPAGVPLHAGIQALLPALQRREAAQ